MDEHGGPAFPQHGWSSDPEVVQRMQKCGGMTLRDWFAGQALNGALSNPEFRDMPLNEIAVWAYHTAEAMLKERQAAK